MISYIRHLWHVAVVDPNASQGSQSATFAALGVVSISDLPKEWLVAAVLLMFGWISFFVKRDYQRMNDKIHALEDRATKAEVALSDKVSHRENGDSVGRVHEKVNKLRERARALEVHTKFPVKSEDGEMTETTSADPEEDSSLRPR